MIYHSNKKYKDKGAQPYLFFFYSFKCCTNASYVTKLYCDLKALVLLITHMDYST